MHLPQPLIQSLQGVPGFDEENFKRIHNTGEQVTSIRLNPTKNYNSKFLIHNSEFENVPWSSHGYYLPQRPSFTLDPTFHAGGYYVQEASSMFLEEVLKQTVDLSQPLRVLDLCAAPGGKSTLIHSLISEESLLVSNEIIKSRVTILIENIVKWGCQNVVVTNNEAKDFQRLPGYFDVIVADAPCSGSGLFRKDPPAINEWSPANVEMCGNRQQQILHDVMPALKEDGILIYSTCSYSSRENEQVADLLTEMDLMPLRLTLNPEWNVIETFSGKHQSPGYRFYPDKLRGEGFYIAAFKKQSRQSKTELKKHKFSLVSSKDIDSISPFIKTESSHFIHWHNDILSIPFNRLNDLATIQSALYIKKAGVNTGTLKNAEFIPHHELALCNLLNENVPFLSVELPEALNYLRRTEFSFNTSNKGWKIIRYLNLSLGWIKHLGNRINNYYPKEWRILNK